MVRGDFQRKCFLNYVSEKFFMEYEKVTDRELEFIKKIVGPERISVGESILELHSKDESFHQKRKPDIMVWPLCATEISQILRLANEKRIPITPWRAGTSLEGNPIPVEGGIILDLQQMSHILELRTEDLHVRVEAGVIYKELNQYLSRYGLFFPPDPGASATIGGMVGNNASGIRTIKYGATNDFVDEADQKTFRSPWHHESGEDFCLASCIGLKA
jgi:D-lactate dehydrogenase (cytochrome)